MVAFHLRYIFPIMSKENPMHRSWGMASRALLLVLAAASFPLASFAAPSSTTAAPPASAPTKASPTAAATAAGTVAVAVAANFTAPLDEIGRAFEAATGNHLQVSAGSTGKLAAQIQNGAPFDVLLAADSERPAALEKAGQSVAGSRFT